MSKKQKRIQKRPVQPQTVIHATRSKEPAPEFIPKPAPIQVIPEVENVALAEPEQQATVREVRDASLPFWVRAPFAMIDFWMSQIPRSDRKT